MGLWRAAILVVALLAMVPAAGPGRADVPSETLTGAAEEAPTGPPWVIQAADGTSRVRLYFFHSDTCPYCERARPVVADIVAQRPWLELMSHAVQTDAGQRAFEMLARMAGVTAEAVPTFFVCGEVKVGFVDAATSGREIAALADRCHARLAAGAGARAGDVAVDGSGEPGGDDDTMVAVPFFGKVSAGQVSLPLLAVLLGALDAFNPCAFFVLLFLMSLMIRARSRARMALVGGIFVTTSGLMYFGFMAAWLNLFLVLANVGWITLAAGLVAIAIGALAVKDFFAGGKGPSLSMSGAQKSSLFARMRGLVAAESQALLVGATVMLAVAANLYELVCTSGFPLVFTRVLTLHALSPAARYGYLALYNIVYVLPLFVIVAGFVATLGTRKLSAAQGRALKLLSGLVMLAMGLVLAAAPHLLDSAFAAAAIPAGALTLAAALVAVDRRWRRHG